MKRLASVLAVIALALGLASTALAAPQVRTVDVWYMGLHGPVPEAVPVPQGVSDLPEFALQALLRQDGLGPDLWSEIPAGTRLNGVTMKNGLAVVDFDKSVIQGMTPNHNAGFIMDVIAKTVFQFHEVTAVKITVEGVDPGVVNGVLLGAQVDRSPQVKDSSHKDRRLAPDGTILTIPEIPNPVIYLDAGHGGTESGAVATDGTKEKDINLPVALKVRDYLVARGATVRMSRTTDITKDMNTRVAEANASDVDFIVTIHANSSDSTAARGTQSFYPSTHDQSLSASLATSIHNRMFYVFPEFAPPTVHNGIGLLLYTKHPAALVEMGFMSSTTDLNPWRRQSP